MTRSLLDPDKKIVHYKGHRVPFGTQAHYVCVILSSHGILSDYLKEGKKGPIGLCSVVREGMAASRKAHRIKRDWSTYQLLMGRRNMMP